MYFFFIPDPWLTFVYENAFLQWKWQQWGKSLQVVILTCCELHGDIFCWNWDAKKSWVITERQTDCQIAVVSSPFLISSAKSPVHKVNVTDMAHVHELFAETDHFSIKIPLWPVHWLPVKRGSLGGTIHLPLNWLLQDRFSRMGWNRIWISASKYDAK